MAPLATLVLLSSERQRLPRLWLWLPGLVIALAVPRALSLVGPRVLNGPDPYLWLVPIAVAVAWIGVDARPAAGMSFCFMLWLAQCLLDNWEGQLHALSLLTNTGVTWQISTLLWTSPWFNGLLWTGAQTWIAALLGLATLGLGRLRRQAFL